MKFAIGDRVMIRCAGWTRSVPGTVLNVIKGVKPDGNKIEPYCVLRDDKPTPGWFAAGELTKIKKHKKRIFKKAGKR